MKHDLGSYMYDLDDSCAFYIPAYCLYICVAGVVVLRCTGESTNLCGSRVGEARGHSSLETITGCASPRLTVHQAICTYRVLVSRVNYRILKSLALGK